MSNNTKLTIKNSEGDPALIIGLSIFAYTDFDALAKAIKDSIDAKSAAETKKKLIELVMVKDNKFHVAKSYRKSIEIIADRETDEHNTLTTKPISTQLEEIAVLQKFLDNTTIEDDVELTDSAKLTDELVKNMHAIMDKTDGDIFEAYEKAKKQKGIKTEDDGDTDAKDTEKKTPKITDPFEVPVGLEDEKDPLSKDTKELGDNKPSKKDGKSDKSLETKPGDSDSADATEEDLKETKEKNAVIKDALPFSKFDLSPTEADKTSFLKDNTATKITTSKPEDEVGKKKKAEDSQRKDSSDKEDAIKKALPFSAFSLDGKEPEEDDKKEDEKLDDMEVVIDEKK